MSLHKDYLVHDSSKRTIDKLKKKKKQQKTEIKQQILRTAYVKEFKFKAALFYLAGPDYLFACPLTPSIIYVMESISLK